jgi:FkbM family methyltransferase
MKLLGKPFIVPMGLLETFWILEASIITANQYHVELIKENAYVVDAGANIGVFSVFAAVSHPNSTIYSFEPTPSTFAALKENTKYYPNIKVFNCGLGEINKMATIVNALGMGDANYIGEGGTPVEVKTIDSFNLSMDFLKIDTEGYEANILKGAAETIKKYKPTIVMSAYHKPNDKTELPAILNSLIPYDCELRHDDEEDLICKPV